MKHSIKHFLSVGLLALFVLGLQHLRADEGMWLYENAPTAKINEKYGFRLSDSQLTEMRLASCHFGNSGSASFVSPQGLIITNHHVGTRFLHALSTMENNLLENGFYAEKLEDELPCPGLEVIVLEKMLDVTDALAQFLKNVKPEQLATLRGQRLAELEQQYANEWQLRVATITLYQGGKYHLYGYKVYDDIRLVWAPEEKIAAFGGDPDNYEYPRFCLDACLFRAYEGDKPAQIKHYLKWGTGSVEDGELLFVSGFPGVTNRAYTKEHLEFLRDVYFPHRLAKLFRREVIFSAFAARSLENKLKVARELAVVQNYRKRAMGQLDGLQTPSLWRTKAEKERSDTPEARIAQASQAARQQFYAYDLLEEGDLMKTFCGDAFNSQTFQIAKTIVRMALETAKPDAERLKAFRDTSLEATKAALFVDTPIDEDVEILKLTDSLTMLCEGNFRSTDNLWETVLEAFAYSTVPLGEEPIALPNLSPKQCALELIHGSKVRDVAERKRLVEGGVKAIQESTDPMIRFAAVLENMCRELGKEYAENVTNPMTEAYAELARRRFAEHGTDVYPDATLTLRLSYGIVKGYTEDSNTEKGTEIPPTTTIAGMFDRAASHKNIEPFDPPQSWKDAKDKLDPNTIFNFVSTNDIIGGNSGSPVINRKGEIVGLAFDGNIHSLSNNFVYDETRSRCVAVHADVILESLKKIYGADRIVKELASK